MMPQRFHLEMLLALDYFKPFKNPLVYHSTHIRIPFCKILLPDWLEGIKGKVPVTHTQKMLEVEARLTIGCNSCKLTQDLLGFFSNPFKDELLMGLLK